MDTISIVSISVISKSTELSVYFSLINTHLYMYVTIFQLFIFLVAPHTLCSYGHGKITCAGDSTIGFVARIKHKLRQKIDSEIIILKTIKAP